jgi:hypothetical protein
LADLERSMSDWQVLLVGIDRKRGEKGLVAGNKGFATHFPLGNLKLGLNQASHAEGGIDAALDSELGAYSGDSGNLERGTGEWQVENDLLLLIRHAGEGLEGDHTGDLTLVVEGQVALVEVEGQGETLNDEGEAEARLDLDIEDGLAEQVAIVVDALYRSGAILRLVKQLCRDAVIVLVRELALDLGFHEGRQPLEDALAEPPLVQVPRGNLVKVEVVAEFLLEPAHRVPADVFKRALSEPLATMDVPLPADGPGDNVVPVVVLVAVVDAHLGVAKATRHAVEIVVKSQVVDDRLEAGEVRQISFIAGTLPSRGIA